MSKEVDGNLHYLNQYLDEQERNERDLGVGGNDKEEFTGDDLYDIFVDATFESIVTEFDEYIAEYPDAGFDEAKELAIKYLELKRKLSKQQYMEKATKDLYKNLNYWFDAKWLITRSIQEDLVLDRIDEVISDLVFSDSIVTPEEVVQTYTLVYDIKEDITEKEEGIVRNIRLNSAKEGIEKAGLTKEFVNNSSPDKVYIKLIENNKLVGRNKKKLQVSDSQADNIYKSLRINTNELEDIPRVYAEIYRLYNKPTTSNQYLPTIKRINELLQQRVQEDKGMDISVNVYKEEGLVVYGTKNNWIVVGGNLRVFVKNNGDDKLVYNKPVYKVRVKDLQKVIKWIN